VYNYHTLMENQKRSDFSGNEEDPPTDYPGFFLQAKESGSRHPPLRRFRPFNSLHRKLDQGLLGRGFLPEQRMRLKPLRDILTFYML
jgi:hypothetical protein